MDIIVLLICGFLLLIFILAFRGRHTTGVERLMRQNKNVAPLFKERSAGMKYDTLYQTFQNKPAALQALQKLQTDFLNKDISIDTYNQQLDKWLADNS